MPQSKTKLEGHLKIVYFSYNLHRVVVMNGTCGVRVDENEAFKDPVSSS